MREGWTCLQCGKELTSSGQCPDWYQHFIDSKAMPVPKTYTDLAVALADSQAEVAKLREAIQSQCQHLCTEAWTSRGMHHPDCLAHELEGGEDE